MSAMSVFNLTQIALLPVDADKLRQATNTDSVLSKVVMYTQRGWPTSVDAELKPYANCDRSSLSKQDACCGG